MKTLYLDCGMGAAGDMLTAALVELLPDPDAFIQRLNALGIPGVFVRRTPCVKCGIAGSHISVMVNGEEEESHDYHAHDGDVTHHSHHAHHLHNHSQHRGMDDIKHIVQEHLSIPEKVKKDVIAVYSLIAEAESHVHSMPIADLHFHEVGTMDAIADITAVCLLMDMLSPDEVIVSPIHVGSGQVWCAHGILPVPTPATAYILKDVPIYGGHIKGELCTPTGAALLKYFATCFGDMPVMRTQAIGYGMGKKDFEAANCVRAMLSEAGNQMDLVLELSCNVDDMTAEQIGFATERLFENGARDVYTIPIGMKKSRPGTLICVICSEQDREAMVTSLFKHTTTLGIRETTVRRHVLHREVTALETPFGVIHRKDSDGYGIHRSKYEYEDLARIAREQNINIADANTLICKQCSI